ncbi:MULTISPECIES: VOC family protein [unclassified Streptomyces]|uniref:VOC family protein n=1 Tax=unclassified Streptomyces TaxID=2593676 RepID=UPI002DDA03BD|nr:MULTISPECIES: VOC family protein [unclassified Streptomyces]WSB77603.1 VOC family protein [Streptomyces sp. NBC_01775]WSS14130.1 VOC family protein [Streptomyces sp. NBC_01186]WSS42952.1 VOC family protein [Streptomyces sp. NBC_01187]
MPGINGIAWFEIGTDDPEGAERFYGDMFGWTVAHDDTKSTDQAYQIFTTGDPEGLRGGLFATKGKMPNYAVFTVLVEDVEAACRRAEAAGGAVQRAPEVNPVGVKFAHLLDPAGNHFAVFTPPSVQP